MPIALRARRTKRRYRNLDWRLPRAEAERRERICGCGLSNNDICFGCEFSDQPRIAGVEAALASVQVEVRGGLTHPTRRRGL